MRISHCKGLEIAQSIVTRLQLSTTPSTAIARQPRRVDIEAYDLYLKGRFHWNRRTEDGLRRSIDLFRQSIARDSLFALAHASLADAYTILGTYFFMPPSEALQLARIAAQKALQLDSTLA